MESRPFKLKNWITSFTVLVAAIFLIGGCALANHPPVIANLKAEPGAVSPSGVCHIECIAPDEDGDELSYEWFASDGNIDGDGAAVNWSAPESEGIYNILVKVTDGNGGEVSQSIAVKVGVNHPPSITSLTADVGWVTPSGSCNITCNAEDPDGDELIYKWSADGGDISGIGSLVTWAAPDAVGLYNITAVVSDGYGGEGTRLLTINVALNPPPVIEGLIVTPQGHEYLEEYSGGYKILKGRGCEIECVVTNASDEIVYEWSASKGEISGTGSVATWTASEKGEVTVTVTVSDSSGGVATKNIIFEVLTCTCAFN